MSKKVLIGAISGLAAGVVVGILTAPASGSETRQKISDSTTDLKKRLQRLTGKAKSELDELSDLFQNEVEGLGEDVREKVLQLLEASKETYKNVKEEVLA